MVDDVPDGNFVASLDSASGHDPFLAKSSSGDAWCSVEIDDVNISPYIQVNFETAVEIHSVTVGGHTALPFFRREYIVNYKIRYRPVGGEEQFIIDDNGNPQVRSRIVCYDY